MHKGILPYLSMVLATGGMLPARGERLPIDVNHPAIRKALLTLKYRLQNKVNHWTKFNKRLPNNDELSKILHDTISSVGNELHTKEFCDVFYNTVKQYIEQAQKDKREKEDELSADS